MSDTLRVKGYRAGDYLVFHCNKTFDVFDLKAMYSHDSNTIEDFLTPNNNVARMVIEGAGGNNMLTNKM